MLVCHVTCIGMSCDLPVVCVCVCVCVHVMFSIHGVFSLFFSSYVQSVQYLSLSLCLARSESAQFLSGYG